jgi:hypothetical protein
VLREANRIAGFDGLRNPVFVTAEDGHTVWGHEFPTAFTFQGLLRGKFELLPADRSKWTPPMELTSKHGGDHTDVVIELADGDLVHIQRTSGEVMSAKHQTFTFESTARHRVKPNEQPTPIDTNDLTDVVAMPGLPFSIKVGGKLRTTGPDNPVVRITAWDSTQPVASDHPWLTKKPEMRRSVVQDFDMAMAA